jgi:CTP-dependent riboflavin kinase
LIEMDSISIRGTVTTGLNESAFFTSLPWVKKQLISKLGIDPYPGTFNLAITDRAEMEKWRKIRQSGSIVIFPEGSGFCPARAFPVMVQNKVRGAIVLPEIAGYPETKIEIISEVRIMDALTLKNGDRVEIEIVPS